MKKTSNFHDCPYEGWPAPIDIKPLFSPARWTSGGNDNWGFRAIGSDGVQGAPGGNGPSYAGLTLTGVPNLGVTLQYDRWTKSTRQRDSYNSKGDLSQLLQFARSLHDDQLSLGLFVPFDQAWLATKQFLESDGELPEGIDWIDARNLPPEAFPCLESIAEKRARSSYSGLQSSDENAATNFLFPRWTRRIEHRMTESKESIQERDWQILHDRITDVLDRYGVKDAFREGDYWLVDDNWGDVQQLEFQKLDLLSPQIVRMLQETLAGYPKWSITVRVDVVGKEKEWPGMGIIIYPDEVIDELQRDYLPDRFQNLIFGTIPPPPETQEQLAEKVRKLMKPKT